jgi:hypothetical protein
MCIVLDGDDGDLTERGFVTLNTVSDYADDDGFFDDLKGSPLVPKCVYPVSFHIDIIIQIL